MIRMTIDTRPSGVTVLTVTATLGSSFDAMPREVQTRMIESALTRANDTVPTLLSQPDRPIAVPA